jgi:hypothetical protein
LELGEEPDSVDSSTEALIKIYREFMPDRDAHGVSFKKIVELLNLRPRNLEDRFKKAQNECARVKFNNIFQGRKISLMEKELKRVEDRIEHVLQVARTNKPVEEKDEPSDNFSNEDDQSLLQPDVSTSEVLMLYGNLFYCLFNKTDYLANVIPHLNSSDLEVVVSFVVNVLYSNPYSEIEEMNLISLITVSYSQLFSQL